MCGMDLNLAPLGQNIIEANAFRSGFPCSRVGVCLSQILRF